MKLDSKTASFYYSRPSEWLDGRRAIVPCANVLGGGSSINFMVRLLNTILFFFEVLANPHAWCTDVHSSISL